jgi:hypothetical protein
MFELENLTQWKYMCHIAQGLFGGASNAGRKYISEK